MGVDKFKEDNNTVLELHRFITIAVPMNAYLRRPRGDAHMLPYAWVSKRLFFSQAQNTQTIEAMLSLRVTREIEQTVHPQVQRLFFRRTRTHTRALRPT